MILSVNIDEVVLNFSPNSLKTLNIILGLIVFGIALNLKVDDFKEIIKKPKPFLVGTFSQIVLLPLLTFLLVLVLNPKPSLALGMLLVAACPGGNVSNFITQIAGGNSALSISMSANSTLISSITTPFLFSFYAYRFKPAQEILQQVHLDFFSMLILIATIVGLPLLIGLFFSHYFPLLAKKLHKVFTFLSILFFVCFIIFAIKANANHFFTWFSSIILLVAIMNFIAFLSGYSIAKLFKLSLANVKSITIETGIQNSGLGMILIVNFFNGLGGMMLIAAFWGIWHIIIGLIIAFFWRRFS